MTIDANKLDVYALAEVINQKDNDPTNELRLRRGVVTAVSGGTASVTIGGATVAGIPFYRGVWINVGDVVDVLIDGPAPRIVGVLSGADKAGAPGLVKIAEAGPLGSVQTITFASIPQTFSALKIIGSARQGGDTQLGMYLNGGAGTQSYDNTTMQGVFGSATVARGSAVNQGRAFCGDITADGVAGNGYSNVEITIADYAQTRPKHIMTLNVGGLDDAPYMAMHTSRFYDQAPITQILLLGHFSGAGLGIGTHLTLYGVV